MIDQGELTRIYCARPQNFAWFLGAGASAAAGLPTATDVIWYLKRRYYCAEENQDISRQDFQVDAIRARIQQYMISRGFPEEGARDEYTTYFEKIFGAERERQRRFLSAFLSEDKVTLSIGNRVLAALMAARLCRVVFTTNFDTVLEKAFAEISDRSIAAYHLEGAGSAQRALDNEEFPLYCKLHGDFRHDSLKNLAHDLASQNAELSQCLINAGNRFGFIVIGYSGRDDSVMDQFWAILKTTNPFPHGLYWATMKGNALPVSVRALLKAAQEVGVSAKHVEIETFDSMMLRFWRNCEAKTPALDKRVRRTEAATVSIPLPPPGQRQPVMRINALPILAMPTLCQSIEFAEDKDWRALRKATRGSEGQLLFTKGRTVLCWGRPDLIREEFADVREITERDMSAELAALDENHFLKGFLEEALGVALACGKPILSRSTKYASFLIADRHADDPAPLAPLTQVTGKAFGDISGLFTAVTEEHPSPEKVSFAEAIRISIDSRNDQYWLVLNPDVWIWPPRSREDAIDFLNKRRGDRFNAKFNALLDAWIAVLLGEGKTSVRVSAFEDGSEAQNPTFVIGPGSAFSRRSSAS